MVETQDRNWLGNQRRASYDHLATLVTFRREFLAYKYSWDSRRKAQMLALYRCALPAGVWDSWKVGTFWQLDIDYLPNTRKAVIILFGQ